MRAETDLRPSLWRTFPSKKMSIQAENQPIETNSAGHGRLAIALD